MARAEAAQSFAADQRLRWQRRLLPLMSQMVVGLTIFFFAATFVQLVFLQSELRRESPMATSDAVRQLTASASAPFSDRLAVAQFHANVELEVQIVSRRYNQARILLMSRVWTRYLGFVTGMILCLVGAAFILGKLQEPESELSVGAGAAGLALKSASPGLLLAALGAVVIVVSSVVTQRVDVIDTPLYLRQAPTFAPASSRPEPPPLDDPYAKPRTE